jgi:hypothetical protein
MTRRLLLCLLLLLLLAPGCAETNEAVVTGTITVDGTPAKTGYIGFIPVDGKSATSGAEIKDGKYTANVPLGTMKVQIRVPKVVGQQKLYNTPDSPVQPIMAETLPPKYHDQTELVLDVKPGTNEQDYPLLTK